MDSLMTLLGFNDFLFGLEVFDEHFSVYVLKVALNVFLISNEGRNGLAGLGAFGAFPQRGTGTRYLILIRRDFLSFTLLIRRVYDFIGALRNITSFSE
jgi:hypothetical protein